MGNILFGRLAFLILLPLVYEGLMYMENTSKKENTLCFIAATVIDYIIIGIYVYNVYRITGTWVFTEACKNVAADSFDVFVMLAVIYVVAAIICSFLVSIDNSVESSEELPITHVIVLMILFTIFSMMDATYLHSEIDKNVYDAMEYSIDTSEIKLKLMSDTHGVDGSIDGQSVLGSGYISGKIQDNYKIYYSYLSSTGETIIDSFVYNNDNVDIFEQENCVEPKLIINRYYKSYETEHNSYSHEYYTYTLYIPAIKSEINLDLE